MPTRPRKEPTAKPDPDEAAPGEGDETAEPAADTEPARPPLTGKQRRKLRALGHHLEPVVQLGKHGLTEAATAAVDAALTQHELVKVRLGTECPDDRADVAERLGAPLRAEVAQLLGRTILVYRRHPKKPKIAL